MNAKRLAILLATIGFLMSWATTVVAQQSLEQQLDAVVSGRQTMARGANGNAGSAKDKSVFKSKVEAALQGRGEQYVPGPNGPQPNPRTDNLGIILPKDYRSYEQWVVDQPMYDWNGRYRGNQQIRYLQVDQLSQKGLSELVLATYENGRYLPVNMELNPELARRAQEYNQQGTDPRTRPKEGRRLAVQQMLVVEILDFQTSRVVMVQGGGLEVGTTTVTIRLNASIYEVESGHQRVVKGVEASERGIISANIWAQMFMKEASITYLQGMPSRVLAKAAKTALDRLAKEDPGKLIWGQDTPFDWIEGEVTNSQTTPEDDSFVVISQSGQKVGRLVDIIDGPKEGGWVVELDGPAKGGEVFKVYSARNGQEGRYTGFKIQVRRIDKEAHQANCIFKTLEKDFGPGQTVLERKQSGQSQPEATVERPQPRQKTTFEQFQDAKVGDKISWGESFQPKDSELLGFMVFPSLDPSENEVMPEKGKSKTDWLESGRVCAICKPASNGQFTTAFKAVIGEADEAQGGWICWVSPNDRRQAEAGIAQQGWKVFPYQPEKTGR